MREHEVLFLLGLRVPVLEGGSGWWEAPCRQLRSRSQPELLLWHKTHVFGARFTTEAMGSFHSSYLDAVDST